MSLARFAFALLSVALVIALGCSGQDRSTPSPTAETGGSVPATALADDGADGAVSETLGADESAANQPPAASDAGADPASDSPSPSEAQATAAANAPAGPYWPRFHGPQGDNRSSDTGLLKSWPEDGPPLEWTVEGIGNGYSSVSLAHGMIYTAGNIEGKTVISAIGLDGQLRWQIENGPAWTGDTPGTRSTPTIDGDRLYHQSPVGNLLCANAASGEPLWTTNTLESFEAENITWALSESPLVDGPRVITCPGGKAASVAALDKMTGELVWAAESTGDKTGYASPTLAEYQGRRMIFTMNAKAVIGVDADSGQLLFRDPYETEYDVNAFMPIFHEGHLFVSTGYGGTGSRLLKINVQGSEVGVERVWESKEMDNQHGGAILLDGFIYGSADRFNNAKLICLDWKTGEMKWGERALGKGSLTYADGLLYLYSERRAVGLARATPESFELISQFRLPPGGKGASWAHPVVCGGRLYLRYDERLFAYNVRAN